MLRYINYGYRDADTDLEWANRALTIVEKNYKHWECFYAFAYFSDPMGCDVLRRIPGKTKRNNYPS